MNKNLTGLKTLRFKEILKVLFKKNRAHEMRLN